MSEHVYSVSRHARQLHVRGHGCGYTCAQVLGALHAVAANQLQQLVVLPLPVRAIGELVIVV